MPASLVLLTLPGAYNRLQRAIRCRLAWTVTGMDAADPADLYLLKKRLGLTQPQVVWVALALLYPGRNFGANA